MAVVNVKRMWTLERLERQLGYYVGKRAYSVLMDNPSDGPELALAHADIPAENSAWSATIPIRVTKRSARERTHPLIWIIEVDYNSTGIASFEIPDDPLQEPPSIEYDGVEYELEADVDVDGKPIVNTAKDSLRGFSRILSNGLLTYTRNEATYNEPWASLYRGKVNSVDFLGVGPRKVRCRRISARQQFKNGIPYWTITYQFEYRLPDWDERPLNMGRRELAVVGGVTKKREITDENGQPVSDPVFLKPDGTKNLNPTQAEMNAAKLGPFKLLDQVDFNELNIV